MTAPDIDRHQARRRWLPAAAGATVMVLLTGAMAWPRPTADAATTPAATPPQPVVATPTSIASSRDCRIPQPLTVTQIAALGKEPAQPPAALGAPRFCLADHGFRSLNRYGAW